MGLLDRVSAAYKELRGNPLNNPAVPMTMAGFLGAFSGEPTASGESITLSTAMQQATVSACRRVICDAIASLPLKVYESTSGGGKREVPDHALADLLQVAANEEMSSFTFVESLTGSLVLTGNGYAEIQRDEGGRAVGFWPLHPEETQARRIKGALVYETRTGMPGGQARLIAPEDMLHVPLFSFDGISGLSPIALARQGIGLARAAEKFGGKWFGNGARPGGVMSSSTELDDDAQVAVVNSWHRTQGGENQGKTAFLFGDWKYQPIGISPEDSQFLETRQFQRTEIAAMFGVAPHLVGDNSKISNSSYQQMNLSFLQDCIRPYISRVESELNRKLIPRIGRNAGRYFIQFDVSERLRLDIESTMRTIALGRQWGVITGNESRHMLGLNPYPDASADQLITAVNMANQKQVTAQADEENVMEQPVKAPAKDPE